jgi:calcineurin-like phosphoesterase family protein
MSNIFLIGCTHFGHENMYKFLNKDGTRVRHEFADSKEGDEAMVERWNNTVNKGDKVYVLGDVAFHKTHLATVGRLNGSKILVKGNHDNLQLAEYAKYFRDVRAYHRLVDDLVLSHVPVHPRSLWSERNNKYWINIHAHLHSGAVMSLLDNSLSDYRYFSVCVERINYTPISLEEVRVRTGASDVETKMKEETK